jgi:hypothetical protein
MCHNNVTYLVLQMSHNAWNFHGPDAIHYEHIYCTNCLIMLAESDNPSTSRQLIDTANVSGKGALPGTVNITSCGRRLDAFPIL